MTSFQPLLRARPTDPFVQWVVRDLAPDRLVTAGENIAWIWRGRQDGEVWATALGDDPVRVVGLVEQLAAERAIDGVTVPDDAFALLPVELQSPDPGHWCFWVLDPADAPSVPATAVDLDLDDSRIAPLLAHSTSAHVFPGDPALVRWAGVLDGDRLVSVAGQVVESTGAAHVVSVCTDPAVRGRGLARQACARIIEAAVAAGAPRIVLEMYAANEAGRRTYSALGFAEVGRYRSGLLRLPDTDGGLSPPSVRLPT